MAGPLDDEEREKPLDPAVERVRRKLIRFMAFNLGLLFLALMAVAIAIVYRASGKGEPPAAAVPELPAPPQGEMLRGEIALPQGARVLGHTLSGSHIGLDVMLAEGTRAIFVYDTAAGRIVGRFDIAPAP